MVQSTIERVTAWAVNRDGTQLTIDPSPKAMFVDVLVNGDVAIRWLRASDGQKLLLTAITPSEEVLLRQGLSNPGSIARQPSIDGAVTVHLQQTGDLETVLEIMARRLDGSPAVVSANFSGRWGEFIYWGSRFYETAEFDKNERNYKLKIGENLERARTALRENDPDWMVLLRRSFKSPNNLTYWRMHDTFLRWAEEYPEIVRPALQLIWEPQEPRRIRSFLRNVPESVVGGPAGRLALASFLQMAIDVRSYPIYRNAPVTRGYHLTGFDNPPENADEQTIYDHALLFLDQITDEAAARSVQLRDRLDAQSLLWCVTSWDTSFPPGSVWSTDDQIRFHRFRGDPLPITPE